ncbi:MAG TPA: SPFH domain-containing protein [Polyangia bacterium]|nr:SPFH domain-containing protein [Polyangia bacterium]
MDSSSATSIWSELSARLGFGETSLSFLIGGGAGLLVLLSIMFAARFLYLCRPSEILIFSGRKHRLADGSEVGSRVVFGGRAWRRPLIENVQRMQMLSMPIDVQVQGAYTKVGIPLKVRAIALIKLSSDPSVVMNAIERFLGRGLGDIQQVAKETLEGNLRGVLATLTPEEVNEDRLKFADSLAAEVEQDLSKLGLHLDVLKIQHVTDDANYLASIGRERIAQVIRDAEIAESNARNEAAKEAAGAEMRAKVAEADADRAILQKRNELRTIAAELDGQVKSAEARAEQAGLAAQATAEQALQAVRRDLEALRLQAEVVVPAEARREASQLDAAGQAAPIAENGRASAESLRFVADAWKAAGPSAPDMFLINKLEEITRIVVDSVGQIELGPVQLVDGGDGQTFPRFAAAYPHAVATVLRALAQTTGVDVTALLTPVGVGAAGDADVRPTGGAA